MKRELTTEQSQRLLDLGLPEEKASFCEKAFDDGYRHNPIFSLDDLIEIVPKYIKYPIEGEFLHPGDFFMRWNNRFLHHEVGYIGYLDKTEWCAEELIDAIFLLLEWLLMNKLYK